MESANMHRRFKNLEARLRAAKPRGLRYVVKRPHAAGFTLTELLLYIAIIAIVALAIVNAYIFLQQGRGRATARAAVNADMNFAVEQISRDLRESQAVAQPGVVGDANATTSLTLTHPVDGDVTYCVADDALRRAVGGGTCDNGSPAINGSDVLVSTPSFIRWENANEFFQFTTVTIEFTLTMEYNDSRPDWQFSESKSTSVTVRRDQAGVSTWFGGNAWPYRKSLTIDSGQVSGASPLSDFPALISRTDPDWRHTSSGGKVGRLDGGDIAFTASNATTQLVHEVESYNPATGELVAWVRIPSLSPSTDTTIYAYYGNAAASVQENAAGTWDSNYEAVWHLNGSAVNVIDSTANGNTGAKQATSWGAGNGHLLTEGSLPTTESFNWGYTGHDSGTTVDFILDLEQAESGEMIQVWGYYGAAGIGRPTNGVIAYSDDPYLSDTYDFDSDTVGACPTGWTCSGSLSEVAAQDDAQGCAVAASNASGNNYIKAGCDTETGYAYSPTFTLPSGADYVEFLRAGGADAGSGFYVRRASDDAALCSSENGSDTDTFFVQTCTGLSAHVGTDVYYAVEDNQNSGWGKVYVDDIKLVRTQSWTTVDSRPNPSAGQPGARLWMMEYDIGSAGAHRYWKWTATDDVGAGNTWIFTSDIQFFSGGTSGGRQVYTDLAESKPVYTNPAPSGSYPNYLTERSLPGETNWTAEPSHLVTHTPHGYTEDWQYGLTGHDSGTTAEFTLDLEQAEAGDVFRVWGAYDVPGGLGRPSAGHLEYSDNNMDWTSVENRTGLAAERTTGRHSWLMEYDISGAGSHRYWRWTATEGSATWIFVSQLEFLAEGTISGERVLSDIAQGKPVTTNPAPNGSYPDYPFFRSTPGAPDYGETNGSLLTRNDMYFVDAWTAGYVGFDSGTTVEIRLDMEQAEQGDLIRLWGVHDLPAGIGRPSAAHLEYSDDDAMWTSVENRTGMANGPGTGLYGWVTEFDISAAGSHRYWRLTLTEGGNTWIFASNLEFMTEVTSGGKTILSNLAQGKPVTTNPAPSGSYPNYITERSISSVVSGPLTTSAQISDGVNFNGATDDITVADPANGSLDFGTNNFQVSFWWDGDNTAADDYLMHKWGGPGWAITERADAWNGGAGKRIGAWVANSGSTAGRAYTISSDTDDGAVHYYVIEFDATGATINFYYDGSSIGKTENFNSGAWPDVSSAAGLGIGDAYAGGFENAGILDEVRISSTLRSADWIQTEYNNQSDPAGFLASVGSEDSYGWPSGWDHRKKITIPAANVSGPSNLTDFPVLISIQDDTDLRDNVGQVDGGDIRFATATGISVAHEMESFNNLDADLLAWVRIPTLSATEDTTIYMYYGNSAGGLSEENPSGVWSSDYRMVYHLDESGATVADSTSNGKTGNKLSASEPAQTASGYIGAAQTFDNSGDRIQVDTPNLPTGNYTYSAWINATDDADEMIFMAANSGGANEFIFSLNTGTLRLWANNNGPFDAATGIPTGQWRHVVYTRSGSVINSYVNGVLDTAPATEGGALNFDSCPLFIGTDVDSGCTGSLGNWFYGTIDEARVQSVARSYGWVVTEFTNQSDPVNFISVGVQESS